MNPNIIKLSLRNVISMHQTQNPNPFSSPLLHHFIPDPPCAMRLIPPNPSHHQLLLLAGVLRRLSTLPPKLKNICYRHRPRALRDAQRALTEYLHTTRALPFSHADNIASNSPFSLSSLVSTVPFPSDLHPSDIPRLLRRFLRYRPVNEFDFFFESIGLPHHPSPRSLPLFLSDDASLLNALSDLVHFGFPWTRLGILYSESPPIFLDKAPGVLLDRLKSFEAIGLRRVAVIGICLAFPYVLENDPGGETDGLFRDLKKVFVDSDLADFAGCGDGDNVDVFLQICRRIRVFYDQGAENGSMGELIGRNWRIFLEVEESVLAQKVRFFRNLGMKDPEAGRFVLQHNGMTDLDLESPSIVMPEYLRHIGLDEMEVASLSQKYPYVMGKNTLGNLPCAMRAMGLQDWFRGKVLGGGLRFVSPDYAYLNSFDEKTQTEFMEDMDKLKSTRKNEFLDVKVEFMLGIGFGENKFTARVVGILSGTREQLQERFDCLLDSGIEYSMICRMINASPKIFNQKSQMIQDKVNYLMNDMGYPLEYLDCFPAFLCFDLENRIRPRFRFLNWLKEKGLLSKHLAPATVLANSEKRFLINLLGIHPAAPKQWLEIFSSRNHCNGLQRVLFLPHPCQCQISKR